MMICPQCESEVPVTEAQYGALFTCPKCMAVYFINFDGRPEYGDMDALDSSVEDLSNPLNLDSLSDMSQNESSFQGLEGGFESSLVPEQGFEDLPAALDEGGSAFVENDDSVSNLSAIEAQSLDEPLLSPLEDEISSLNLFSNNQPFQDQLDKSQSLESLKSEEGQSALESGAAAGLAAAGLMMDSVVQDIQNFANQDDVVSALNYDLLVTGLDTKEVLIQFKEIVEDSRFAWIAEDLLKNIKNGECQIKGLTPVQASVLARRLQIVDVESKWTQNVETL